MTGTAQDATDLEWHPITIGSLSLDHRFVMAPMTRSRAHADGTPGPSAAQYYAQRAGFGLLISEGTQPSADGQGYPWTPGIHTDAHVEGWRQITDAVHAAGGHLFIQLMHVGRYGHPDNTPHGRQLVGPSAIAPQAPIFTAKGLQQPPEPRALDTDEIGQVVEEFRHAARRAVEAGADGVEVHAAGGYLVHSFLGVNSNRRTDRYGGSIENRARFAVEIAQAVADEIGADRVGMRFSPFNTFGDVDEGPDAVALYTHLAEQLDQVGLAYLHVYDFGRDDILAAIRGAWHGPLLVVRDGREPHELTRDLGTGLADAVPVGKLALANPDFVARWRSGAPLNAPDPTTMFGGDDRGYTDYPVLDDTHAADVPAADVPAADAAPAPLSMDWLPDGFTVQEVTAGGHRYSVSTGGSGPVLVLLHGWPQTSRAWRRVMPALAADYTVVVPDLLGAGNTELATEGYTKVEQAAQLGDVLEALGLPRSAHVVGHDIGAMVAVAWAASRPEEVRSLTVLDVTLPGLGLEEVIAESNGQMWHFDFFAAPHPFPEMLFDGHVAEFFGMTFAALSNEGTFSEADMAYYVGAYEGRERLRGGFEQYRAFRQDAVDLRRLVAERRFTMPVLAVGGGARMGDQVADELRPYADHLVADIAPTGHFIPEEAPDWLVDAIRKTTGPR